MTAPYDGDAQYRHLQLARLLAKSSDVPPRLDDPALQAELEALDALEQAERQRQTGEELSNRTVARVEARRMDDEQRERFRYDPPPSLKLVHSAPSQPPDDRGLPTAVEPAEPPATREE